jgi:hypothetical protein
MIHSERAHRRASQPQEIAPGIYCLEAGKGITRSNAYFVRSGSSWTLIDTVSAKCDRVIQEAAESLFGPNTPPPVLGIGANQAEPFWTTMVHDMELAGGEAVCRLSRRA